MTTQIEQDTVESDLTRFFERLAKDLAHSPRFTSADIDRIKESFSEALVATRVGMNSAVEVALTRALIDTKLV